MPQTPARPAPPVPNVPPLGLRNPPSANLERIRMPVMALHVPIVRRGRLTPYVILSWLGALSEE